MKIQRIVAKRASKRRSSKGVVVGEGVWVKTVNSAGEKGEKFCSFFFLRFPFSLFLSRAHAREDLIQRREW
jgi:hypothetical protein